MTQDRYEGLSIEQIQALMATDNPEDVVSEAATDWWATVPWEYKRLLTAAVVIREDVEGEADNGIDTAN